MKVVEIEFQPSTIVQLISGKNCVEMYGEERSASVDQEQVEHSKYFHLIDRCWPTTAFIVIMEVNPPLLIQFTPLWQLSLFISY